MYRPLRALVTAYLPTIRFEPHNHAPGTPGTRRDFFGAQQRYEVRPSGAPHVTLAVAQFYRADPDGSPDFTGWLVSGQSTELLEGPIGGRARALRRLAERAARELALFRCFPQTYPDVPLSAVDPLDSVRRACHLPDYP